MKNQSLTITGAFTTIATILLMRLDLGFSQEQIVDLVLALSVILQQVFFVIHGRARKGDVTYLGRRKEKTE